MLETNRTRFHFSELRHPDSPPVIDKHLIHIGAISICDCERAHRSTKPYDQDKDLSFTDIEPVSILPESRSNVSSILPRLIGKRTAELGGINPYEHAAERHHPCQSE